MAHLWNSVAPCPAIQSLVDVFTAVSFLKAVARSRRNHRASEQATAGDISIQCYSNPYAIYICTRWIILLINTHVQGECNRTGTKAHPRVYSITIHLSYLVAAWPKMRSTFVVHTALSWSKATARSSERAGNCERYSFCFSLWACVVFWYISTKPHKMWHAAGVYTPFNAMYVHQQGYIFTVYFVFLPPGSSREDMMPSPRASLMRSR